MGRQPNKEQLSESLRNPVGVKVMKSCGCGSGMTDRECCYPVKPPIKMGVPKFIKPVDAPQTPLIQQLVWTWKSGDGPGMLSAEQVNPHIAALLQFNLSQVQLFDSGNRNLLIHPLHAVKYHQQQFMYRLYKLKQSKIHDLGRALNSHQVYVFQFEDLPLRCEFEAFVLRLDAFLDAIAKYAADSFGRSKRKGSHGKMLKYLKGIEADDSDAVQQLRETYLQYEPWTADLSRIRNQIIHEGLSYEMTPADTIFEERRYIQPRINGVELEDICLKYWVNVTKFTAEVLRATLLETHPSEHRGSAEV